MLTTLLRGDGNERGTYYTSSDQLAADVLRLCLEVGVKPRYTRRNEMWRVYVRKGNNVFHSSKHVSTRDCQTTLRRLTVDDYSAVMAGRNGRFQWFSVSHVS